MMKMQGVLLFISGPRVSESVLIALEAEGYIESCTLRELISQTTLDIKALLGGTLKNADIGEVKFVKHVREFLQLEDVLGRDAGISQIVGYKNPRASASTIASSRRDEYTIFARPCCPGSFVPNRRLKTLVAAVFGSSVNGHAECNFRNLMTLNSWKVPPGGSETKLNDPNLDAVLKVIKSFIVHTDVTCGKGPLAFTSVMSSQESSPEYQLRYKNHYVLVGSEAKGAEASEFTAYIQGLQICGDAAIELYRAGLGRDNCVVPGILCFGESIIIFAAYLIADCFPVYTQLSEPLSFCSNFTGRQKLVQWASNIASFAENTVSLLQQTFPPLQMKTVSEALIDINSYFFKPVRTAAKGCIFADTNTFSSTARTNLNNIMEVYYVLSQKDGKGQSLILYPQGVVDYPDSSIVSSYDIHVALTARLQADGFAEFQTNSPLIVFERLHHKDGWTNEKPVGEAAVSKYMDLLKNALDLLNKAQVAHLDLRPQNIMWRMHQGVMEMRLIDFETCIPFGLCIPPESATHFARDARYPVFHEEKDNFVLCGEFHNMWFYVSIYKWLDSDVVHFSDFMTHNWENIRTEVASLK
jgi:hypothetical protein